MKSPALLAVSLLFLGIPSLHAQTIELLTRETMWRRPEKSTSWVSDDVRGVDPNAVGSGNQQAEAGESFDLHPRFRNAGSADIGRLVGTARIVGEAAQWARLIRPVADYGAVKAGEKVGKASFRIEAPASAPAPCTLALEVSLVADDRPVGPAPFVIEVLIDRVLELPMEFVAPQALDAGKANPTWPALPGSTRRASSSITSITRSWSRARPDRPAASIAP